MIYSTTMHCGLLLASNAACGTLMIFLLKSLLSGEGFTQGEIHPCTARTPIHRPRPRQGVAALRGPLQPR